MPAIEVDSPEDLRVIEALLQPEPASAQKQAPPPGIKALVMDFDGIHTDDHVYVNQHGEESVRCSRADGLGLALLRRAGMKMLILSSEENPVVAARAGKLGIPVIQGCEKKKAALERWLAEQELEAQEIAYMGNDVNDLECMRMAGWSCCPADAREEAKAVARYRTQASGGRGALREVAEILHKRATL